MSKSTFLDKTLLSAARLAQHSLFADVHASGRGLLQALDVRIKLVSFLGILVFASFLHSPGALWTLYGLSLLLAVFSRVPLGFFLKRVWLFVPLFSAAIVLPALLNLVTPGDPLIVLIRFTDTFTWGPYTIPAEITITRQGLWGAIVLVSRVAVSVSFAVLFTVTSKWSEVFSGLRALGVPQVFIVTLNLALRYLFVLLRLIQDMYRARKSRTLRILSAERERGWIASRIGITFKRSLDMSDDIYRAMLSRGFHGEFRMLNRFRLSYRDAFWIAAILFCSGIILMIERGGRV